MSEVCRFRLSRSVHKPCVQQCMVAVYVQYNFGRVGIGHADA